MAKLLEEKKAENIVILDLRKLTTICDFFVICTSQSPLHSRTLADEIQKKFNKLNFYHVEGYNPGDWILLDFYDVIIHIFTSTTRDYYQIEELWGDAKQINFR